jgi:hypothetical protein
MLNTDIKLIRNCSTPDLLVRVLSPLGGYPDRSIFTTKSAYIADEDISYTIIKFVKFELDPEEYYSEMDWAHPEEIRLFASLLLPVFREGGRTTIYPFQAEGFSISCPVNFENQLFLDRIKTILINMIDAPDIVVAGYPGPQRNSYRNSSGISLPPSNGGPKYNFSNKVIDYQLQSKLYFAIDTNDFLLIRGLSALIKSVMLSSHSLFLEEAIYDLFVSLEASFRIILRVLKQKGNTNPSSADAMNYILNSFNEPQIYISNAGRIRHFKNYFEEYYESRIKSIHPESRFGIFPYAPLQADDFYFLRDDLFDVYTFLLTGITPQGK